MTPIIRNGTYYIKSGLLNSAYLELQNSNIATASWNRFNDALRWMIVSDEDGAYRISCASGLKVLGITNGAIAAVETESKHTWTIEPRGNSFVIGNTADNLVIHYTESGEVEVSDRNNTPNQRWIIDSNPLDVVPTSTSVSLAQGSPNPLHTYSSITTRVRITDNHGWRYCLAIDMPHAVSGLRLESLDLIVKYATTRMSGSHSTYQVDVIVTSAELPTGITSESTALSVYRRDGGNYRPFVLDKNKAEQLYRRFGVKHDSDVDGWRHEIIADSFNPMHIVPSGSRVYILFHVFEYNTSRSDRVVTMDASTSWS